MTAPDSLGLAFPPLETRRAVLVEAAVLAEQLGYGSFYVAEAWGLDAFVVLAEIASRTTRIGLGTCVVNVWSRTPAQLAMAAATLSELSGGRFTLGLGASTPQLVQGLHDVGYEAPLDRLRRTVTQIRSLLAGDRVKLSAGNDARPLRLGVGPAAVPIHLAALAPASVRLTGEIADGWMPFCVPPDRLAAQAELLPCRILPCAGIAVAEDPAAAREMAAWWVAFYLTAMGPVYARILGDLGYGAEVAAVLAANPDRRSAVVPEEAEALFDALTVHGTPADARRRLEPWFGGGAWSPIVSMPPGRPFEEIEFAIRALAG